MSDIVLVALISLAGTALGTFGDILTANRLVQYRLAQLEKKVDKHNQLVEWKIEAIGRMDLIDEKIEVANHRIADLERK